MQVAEWRAQQMQIRGAAPGPLCRNLWILGWSQPSFLSHPEYRSAGHKTAGYHRHPPFLSGCPLSPGTEKKSKYHLWAVSCLCFHSPSCIEVIVTDLISTKELWTRCKSWDLPWSSQAFRWLGLSPSEPWQESLWCWHLGLWMKPRPQSWVWRADDHGDLWGCLCEQLREGQKSREERLKHTFVTLTRPPLHPAL